MQGKKIFISDNLDAIWAAVKADIEERKGVLHYDVALQLPDSKVYLVIDIDLGAGFQGGISTTTLRSVVSNDPLYNFVLYDETFIDEIGKLFGMQDVVIGYPEFDDLLIIKTDDEKATKSAFANKEARQTIQSLNNFSLSLEHRKGAPSFLSLIINEGIADVDRLKALHKAFLSVLQNIQAD